MIKKTGVIFVITGAVLILSALSLCIYNRREAEAAGREAAILLTELQTLMEQAVPEEPIEPLETTVPAEPVPEETVPEETAKPPEELPEPVPKTPEEKLGRLNAEDYIGILTFPTLKLTLPVLSDWDYERLKIAPCRQFGTVGTDDLVVAGHNYTTHFGNLKRLKKGDTVELMTMEKETIVYTVQKIETVGAAEVEKVRDSGYALVLYTCTLEGTTRVVVYCDKEEE